VGEFQVFPSEHFCKQDDLSGVVGKMLDNVENSPQAGNTESLNGICPRESLCVQLPHHTVSFADCLPQPGG
jgi:hypothetical protein